VRTAKVELQAIYTRFLNPVYQGMPLLPYDTGRQAGEEDVIGITTLDLGEILDPIVQISLADQFHILQADDPVAYGQTRQTRLDINRWFEGDALGHRPSPTGLKGSLDHLSRRCGRG
jgi:hypothetical protein